VYGDDTAGAAQFLDRLESLGRASETTRAHAGATRFRRV